MTVRLEAICPRCKMPIVIFYNKGRDRVIWFDSYAAEHIHQPRDTEERIRSFDRILREAFPLEEE